MHDMVALNRLRRRLLKARSFGDISSKDQQLCQVSAQLLDDERQAWVVVMESLRTKLIAAKSDAQAGLRKNDCIAAIHLVRENLASALAERAETDGPLYGGGRSKAQIENDLREHIYFEAALVLKAMNKGSYNFAAHKNDHYDQLLCSYAALGYYLVTDDRRIVEMLNGVDCPEPRIVSVADALDEMGAT
jgi:hypothetical protein